MEKITGNYELLYIVHPDLESSIDKILDKVKGFIEKRKGKITYEENWGKRKLAYEINKSDVGIYILWYFTAPKASIIKIEKDIRLTEEIIRFLILKLEEKPKPRKAKTTKVKKPVVKVKETKTEPVKKKTQPKKKESDKARMEKIDEKLNKLLGDEENKEKNQKKEA